MDTTHSLLEPPDCAAAEAKSWIMNSHGAQPVRITNRILAGPLDLSHQAIDAPVVFWNCVFKGPIDFRYSRFQQTVRFDYCEFQQEFNSGDNRQACTTYEKDLHFHGCTFHSDALFNGVTSNGSLYCSDTTFRADARDLDLGGCSFKLSVDFERVTFFGGLNFNGGHCGLLASFSHCRFLSRKNEVNLVGASFGKNCQFDHSVFYGGARLTNMTCGLLAVFERCEFTSGEIVRFSGSRVAGISCIECEFCGGASFEFVRCHTARVIRTKFRNSNKKIVFSYMNVEGGLSCDGSLFEGPVLFNGLFCKGDASFRGAVFNHSGGDEKPDLDTEEETRGGVQMKFAEIGINLHLNRSRVNGTLPFTA
jgi:hypothetical protein